MPKEDCKYWDKCYQTNEQHISRYNHPEKSDKDDLSKKKKEKRNDEFSNLESQNGNVEVASTSNNVGANEERQEIDTTDIRKDALANISMKNYMEILQNRIKISIQSEYDELLKTNEFIRYKFLVEMPKDFYSFWKFATEQAKKMCPIEHFEKKFQLQMVGAFDFLAGKFKGAVIREPGDYLRHWRFYYDPPEFQTIFVKKGTGIHYGYWRDNPKDNEKLLIARNDASKGCEFELVASNAFHALLHYLEVDFKSTPFNAGTVAQIKKSIKSYIEINEIKLDSFEKVKRERDAHVVTKAFHRAGIVVPVDKKTTIGYRPLMVSDAEIKKILNLFEVGAVDKDEKNNEAIKKAVIEKLQPIVTAASIAVDECDFGTSLELGIDLFCSGRQELRQIIQTLLVPAYTLLERPQFIAIYKAHTEERSKSFNLSMFNSDDKN